MNNGKSRPITFGMIVGNRGFFPGHLAQSGRTEMIAAIEKGGYGVVTVGPEDTKHGAIESRADTLPAIIAELASSRLSERQGRMIDHDSGGSMERKKHEGYF